MTFQKYVKLSGQNGILDIVINKIVIHTHTGLRKIVLMRIVSVYVPIWKSILSRHFIVLILYVQIYIYQKLKWAYFEIK